jgi:hypothetical protein
MKFTFTANIVQPVLGDVVAPIAAKFSQKKKAKTTVQCAEPTQDAGVCAINAKEKNMNESTPEFQLTICCNNCEKYPYCEDFQRWARNSEGSGVTHYIMTHDSCPTCGQQTGEEYPTTVKKANGIMLCTCCGNKLFVPRLKNKGKDKCE